MDWDSFAKLVALLTEVKPPAFGQEKIIDSKNRFITARTHPQRWICSFLLSLFNYDFNPLLQWPLTHTKIVVDPCRFCVRVQSRSHPGQFGIINIHHALTRFKGWNYSDLWVNLDVMKP